ncbi:MAG: hypothetical protein LBO20_07640, partial [Bifidobacteriaceae bacterium]|nr:hypothetical protein [Bifidobacteriaceae bacterium]
MPVAAAAACALALATPPQTPPAAAVGAVTLTVDSLGYAPGDPKPGDGVCGDGAGTCTLRAAIEEGNAQAVDTTVAITVEDGLAGAIIPPSGAAEWMATKKPTAIDVGAYYWITHTMAIDLDNRLGVQAGAESLTAAKAGGAGFWVDAPGVELKNFTDIFASESSIVFSAGSRGSSLVGGSSVQRVNNATDRMVVISPGANDITIRDYTMGRMTSDGGYAGGIVISSLGTQAKTDSISNLTIDHVTIDNSPLAAKDGCQ